MACSFFDVTLGLKVPIVRLATTYSTYVEEKEPEIKALYFEYGRSDLRQYANIVWKNIITEDYITLSFSAGLTCSIRGPPTITTPAEWALNQLHN